MWALRGLEMRHDLAWALRLRLFLPADSKSRAATPTPIDWGGLVTTLPGMVEPLREICRSGSLEAGGSRLGHYPGIAGPDAFRGFRVSGRAAETPKIGHFAGRIPL